MGHLFWAIVHVIGAFGFQYTGILWFLLPGVVHICVTMFVFVIGAAAAFTPSFSISKLNEKIHKEFGYRFLAQIGSIVTAAQLFYVGYHFFAGMAVLQGLILALTVILQKIFDKKEQNL
jgi:hypothetical protein